MYILLGCEVELKLKNEHGFIPELSNYGHRTVGQGKEKASGGNGKNQEVPSLMGGMLGRPCWAEPALGGGAL